MFALLLGAGFLIGGLSESQRLHGEILVYDTFDGGHGALLNQSDAGWLHASGTEGELQQAQGWLQHSSKKTEDVTIAIGDLPRQTASVTPTFQIRSLKDAFPEGAGATAWFEWERGGDLTHSIHLQIFWSGTAVPEEDFMVSEAFLETMKDRLVEGNEVLIAEVRAFAGEALLGDATLEGRILDDDTLSLAQVGGIHWQHADTENTIRAIDVVSNKGDFYRIESSVDLVTWEPRETGVLTEQPQTQSWALDRDHPAQFFRAGAAAE